MQVREFILVAAFVCGTVSASQAASVQVSGCAEPGVEAGCVMLKDGDKTYNITHASPVPIPGEYGTVTGEVSNNADLCMQGDLLESAEWKVDRDKMCEPMK